MCRGRARARDDLCAAGAGWMDAMDGCHIRASPLRPSSGCGRSGTGPVVCGNLETSLGDRQVAPFADAQEAAVPWAQEAGLWLRTLLEDDRM